MNAIAAAMSSGSGAGNAQTLCGITRLCGYIPDADNKDIILLGVVDPDLPPLHLQDLVVAMRNVWGGYDRISGRIRYYSDPGCSIDPNPAVIAQLRDFEMTHAEASTPEAAQKRIEEWKAIGSQPQKVRVMGVPFDSHFAKVMVDADYYMKRIVNGSVKLPVDGLMSLSDLDIEAQRQAIRKGKTTLELGGSLSRFWFSPGESTYEVREGATILRSCEVKLLTEAEFLNEHGVIAELGHADPSADKFAHIFTSKYDQIAAQRPIYRELKALFSLVAVARLMKDDRVDRVTGQSVAYLLRGYGVPCAPVSRAVNGLTDVRNIDENIETPKGTAHLGLIQSCCGGVSMGVHPRRVKTYSPTPAKTIVSAPKTPVAVPLEPVSPAPSVYHAPVASKVAPLSSVHVATTTKPARAVAAQPKTKTPKVRVAQAKSIRSVVLSSRKSKSAMSWDVPVQLD